MWVLKALVGSVLPIASALLLAGRSNIFGIGLPIVLACEQLDGTFGDSGE